MRHQLLGYFDVGFTANAILMCAAVAQRTPSYLGSVSLHDLLHVRVVEEGDASTDEVKLDLLRASARLSIWYRYKQARFEGYLDGTNDVSNSEVMCIYPVLQTGIDQQAHILGVNYRFSDLLDFSLVVP